MRAYFHACSVAYGRIFDPKSPFTETIFEDLKKFCRVNETTYKGDSRIYDMAVAEGRRQVFLRIQAFCELNADQLLEKYTTPATMGENLPFLEENSK